MESALKARVDALRREVVAVYLAAKDPRTPLAARLIIGIVVAYALSPIDLIPDFIPGLGLLDDLILVPVGIALALRLIPPQVMKDAREEALEFGKPRWAAGLVIVLLIWLLVLIGGGWWLSSRIRR